MPRIISLGQIELTKLRNYRWEVVPALDEAGKVVGLVTESYVVTDKGYSSVPEGLQRREVELLGTERKAMTDRLVKYMKAAAEREQVETEYPAESMATS